MTAPSPVQTGRILIIEDELVVALNLQDQIESWGYQVVGIAVTSEAAWALTRKHHPDVVLMDMRLQDGTDGITLANSIRQALGTAIIYITSDTAPEVLQRAESTWPDAYLTKPIRSPELQANLQIVLYQRQQRCLYQRQTRTSTAEAAPVNPACMDLPPLPPPWAGLSLLLVESNESLQSLYAAYLGLLGTTVYTAATIAEAITLLAQTPVAIIISELQLPDGNGPDLLQQVRQQERALERAVVPLLAIATTRDPSMVRLARSVGFADCLVKPFSFALVQSVVQRLVQTSDS